MRLKRSEFKGSCLEINLITGETKTKPHIHVGYFPDTQYYKLSISGKIQNYIKEKFRGKK